MNIGYTSNIFAIAKKPTKGPQTRMSWKILVQFNHHRSDLSGYTDGKQNSKKNYSIL